jgi:NADH-quinone oxidoreductase subunit M
MLITLFIIPLTTFFLIWSVWSKYQSTLNISRQLSNIYYEKAKSTVYRLLKLITISSLFITLFYQLYLWKFYPKIINGLFLYPGAIQSGDIMLFEIANNLNLPFLILSSFVLIISILTVWYSNINMFLFCFMILLLEICLIGAFSCTNMFIFLLFFELSALPIFILIVYCGSARRERLKASYYFLFYTFYGSISLLLVLINVYSLSQINFIINVPLQSNNKILWILLFIAFAVKIPLFPFHIWLPYAHVEASTSTSIILAALMLKLGGYGLIKFVLPLFSVEIHSQLSWIAIFLCIVGMIYASLNAIRQIDLKRYVAFSSIAHMSFAILGIFTLTEIGIKGSIYLMISHGLTSSAMFFLVGILSDRYHTRSITSFSGLLFTMPLFSFFFILISLANAGFPGTSGFIPELEVLIASLSSISINVIFIGLILLGMFLTTIATLLPILRIIFGHIKNISTNSNWIDITKVEFFVLFILSFFIIILGLYDILYWVY